MLRRMVVVVTLALAVNCDGDSDKATAACNRITSTICAKWVECRVLANSTVITPALCQQAQSALVQECVTESSAALNAATDAAIDTCIQDLGATACTAICGQIPQDPASCQMIDPEPSTEMVTCQP